MALLTGRAFIFAGGVRLASKEGAKLDIGAMERTGEIGDAGVLGYKEKPTVPYVECTVAHDAGTQLQTFADMVDVGVFFDTDTGRSYVLRNAWRAGKIEMTNGDVSLRFEGMSCEEV
jgi:hypothetical protein